MPSPLNFLRRFWPVRSQHLGQQLDTASERLGDGLAAASRDLGCTLSDGAHILGWGEPCASEEADSWQQAAGGGRGGFGGTGAKVPTEIQVNLGTIAQIGAALVLLGLVFAGSQLVSDAAMPVQAAPGAAPTTVTVPAPQAEAPMSIEQLLEAELVPDRTSVGNGSGSGQAETNNNRGWGVSTATASACDAQADWFLVPPTPTPTPLPHPLPCQPGKTLVQPPKVASFTWLPQHPTLATQQSQPGGDEAGVTFAIEAQGGTVYRSVGSANGCRTEAQPDPLVRIDMDWVLLPPSVAWIEGTLAQRFYEAYSRAARRGIQCVTVWEGSAQRVSAIYPGWLPLDPGLYGVRVHLHTASSQAALKTTPVPVYLRDSTVVQ